MVMVIGLAKYFLAKMAGNPVRWFTFGFFITAYLVAADCIDVKIKGVGTVRGLTLNTTGTLVDIFWGIPYAKPPVGNLRLVPPQPSEPWSGVRNATYQVHICPQYEMLTSRYTGKEDCLYLNIYRPKKAAITNKLPVMVWIHGGGYILGTNTYYNGEVLAAKNDVIIVTINYRLGILGFFNNPGTETKGNYGLLDQILALKWVKQHIGDFGGNPQQVTIFGESAGGGSVSLLMLAPLTKGLFSRAIAQSGSAANPWAVYEKTNMTQVKDFLSKIGCKDLKSATECLRKKPAKEIVDLQQKLSSYGTILAPITDGNVIKEFPMKQMKEGKLPVTGVDLMIGYNSDEGTMFVPAVAQWNKTYYERQISTILAMKFGPEVNPFATKLVSFHYQSFANPSSADFMKGYKKYLDDYMFKAGIANFAMEWSKQASNTYLYHFAYLPKHLKLPHWRVAHGIEIGFVFGNPFFGKFVNSYFISNYTEEDKQFSLQVMKMWTDFAKTGKPVMSLPVTNAAKKNYFVINNNVTVKENYDPKMMAFWNDYVPEMVKMKGGESKKSCVASGSSYTRANIFGTLVFLVLLLVSLS